MQRAIEWAIAAVAAASFLSPAPAMAQVCSEIVSVPAVITQPGLYCLKRDFAFAGASGAAVTIEANNVTLDLNGFRLGGGGGGPATLATGVYASDRLNVTIRNGTIRAFRNNVVLDANGDGSASRGHVVENLRVEGARKTGITVNGRRSIVRDNVVIDTIDQNAEGAFGILVNVGDGSTIAGNIISGVSSGGAASGIKVVASGAVTVEDNRVLDIVGQPSAAIETSSSMKIIIKDNIAVNNSAGTTGVHLDDGSSRACRDNVVVNFTTPLSGCDLDQGNRIY